MNIATSPPPALSYAGIDVATTKTSFESDYGTFTTQHQIQLSTPIGTVFPDLQSAIESAQELSAGAQPGLGVIQTNTGYSVNSAYVTKLEHLDRSEAKHSGEDTFGVTAQPASSGSVRWNFFQPDSPVEFSDLFQAFVDGDDVFTPSMAQQG